MIAVPIGVAVQCDAPLLPASLLFLSLFRLDCVPQDNADFVMDLEEAKSGTIFKDAAGNTRAGDKMCLSKTCIQNTLDDVFESNMEDIELFDGGGPPVPMSYRTAMFMPYLIPLLIMLFALMPAVICCGNKWKYHMSCCSVVFMCIVMPFMFLFTGLFTPLIIGFHDVCASGPNVGHLFVANSDVKLCSDFGGTYIPASGECQVSFNPMVSGCRAAAACLGVALLTPAVACLPLLLLPGPSGWR